MPVTRETVKDEVRRLLQKDRPIADDENLFAGGYLDSLHIVSLVTHLETTYACAFDFDELTEENLATLDKIADMVAKKKV